MASPHSTPRRQPLSSQHTGRLTPTGANNNNSNGPRRPASPHSLQSPSHRPTTATAASSAAASSPAGPQRSRSVRGGANGTPISARAAVKKPNMSTSSALRSDSSEELARAETSSLMDDLKERLQQADQAVQEMKRHNEALQARLDDATKEQAKMEEKVHEDDERIEELENAKKEVTKQKRELESIYEAERAAVMKDKDASHAREEELQTIIQRLKESLSQKESSRPGNESDISRNGSFTGNSSPTLDANHFAPPSLTRTNSHRNNSKLVLQKDKMIEELRLELAELQIKSMELENKGGGRVQELERSLIEARVTNARLMEENESFQSLLMEKTLNGDFSQKGVHTAGLDRDNGLSASLADELASVAEDEPDHDHERLRRLEVEVERQKAENKALTLYINRIIERILKHQGGFETILSTNDDEPMPTTSGAVQPPYKDKDLPPTPPRNQEEKENAEPQSLLQRARSIAYGNNRRPRPQSVIGPTKSQPSVTEDPDTAPRIPLQRNQSQRHSMALPRRTQTSGEYHPGAAAVVSNMTRSDSDTTAISPGIGSPRTSYIFNRVPSGNRVPSAPESERRVSSSADSIDGSSSESARKAALDALNGDSSDTNGPSIDTPSPPRSLGSKKDGQVLSGNKMRPLRLVTEEQKAKGNRNSWIPNSVTNWFGQNQAAPPPTSNPSQ